MCGNVVFFKYFKVITFILVTGLFTSFGVVLAQTEGSEGWDFSGEQQPSFDLLWPYEDRIAGHSCPVQVEKIYENYSRLHPEYTRHSDNQAMRRAFRRSLLLNSEKEEEYLLGCFEDTLGKRIRHYEHANAVSTDPLVKYVHTLLEWVGWKRKPRNLFCGVLASDLDAQELEIAQSVQELTDYAFAESWHAIWLVLWQDRDTKFFKYNPDIRYYFQLLIKKLTITREQLKEINELIQQPVSNLSTKRRKFVEDAFERGDYQSVLNTTDPC